MGPGSEQTFRSLISYLTVLMALELSLSCETPFAHCPFLCVCFFILRPDHSETAEPPPPKGEFVLQGRGQCRIPLGDIGKLVTRYIQGSSQWLGPGREL